MAENTFKSPGFFEQEIELTAQKQQPTGVPAGIIGAAQMGPAFVPLTLGTFTDFENRFGTLTPEKFAPYAVREWLKNRQSVTFCRVLGAGANSTSTDFAKTRQSGMVKNSGFKIAPAALGADKGSVQFLTAKHTISANSDIGFPIFTDNDTWKATTKDSNFGAINADDIDIVRAMILNTSGSVMQVDETAGVSFGNKCQPSDDNGSNTFKMRIVLPDSTDLSWGYDSSDGIAAGRANRVFNVSLDPDNTKYIGKVLNTDPKKFQEEGHLLWLDFALEHELAPVKIAADAIAISSGANNGTGLPSAYQSDQGITVWQEAFGLFNSRYRAPKTTSFISQPFGSVEYDLFHFECLSDGAVANNEFKISIANIRKSADPNYEYGQFDVLVRKFRDSDFQQEVIERFVGCNLDPNSENFVARKIGDKKVVFDFDADLEEERRLVISGRYPNTSLNIRIVMNEAVYTDQVPKSALPFGFRGIPVLNTNGRLAVAEASNAHLPPIPFVYKATKGKVESDTSALVLSGQGGTNERTDPRVFFGVKTTRIEDDKVATNAILESNLSGRASKIVDAYTKFMGIEGGSAKSALMVDNADTFNNNKFTLARVALGKRISSSGGSTDVVSIDALGGSSGLMKEAAYIRNGVVDSTTYTIDDPYAGSSYARLTFASLIHDKKANNFNKFSQFAKFTNVFYGGWDGVNILDPDIEDLNDRASASDSSDGKAGLVTGGLGLEGTQSGASVSMSGEGKDNNIVASYRQAVKWMTDPMTVRHNLLAIPGIRDPYVTDFAANKVRDYSMAMYVMDIPNYGVVEGVNNSRLYDAGPRPDVEHTSNNLESRAIDNNYVASYFPDVFISDPINNRRVLVPASIAALGALSYSDNVSYPWFAPAGFNRGALDFVENVRTRLAVADRDDLYERRINPIANFPDGGFVIFGQKTMQMNQSALDRVNVRRLLLEVKRQVSEVANVVLFEQNTPQTRARFVNLVQPRLALIQAQAGIEKFRVICDDTNNTPADAEENRLNGKIVLIPTRTIEFIAIDFIITNAGVSFE